MDNEHRTHDKRITVQSKCFRWADAKIKDISNHH
jgi:hypothetical protein